MGECIGFKKMLSAWAFWEREYARRGFTTLSIDAFISAGGYGKSVDHLLGKHRPDHEPPIYHAERYRQNFLGQMPQAFSKEGSVVSWTRTVTPEPSQHGTPFPRRKIHPKKRNATHHPRGSTRASSPPHLPPP